MPSINATGERINEIDLLDLFPAYDGMITQYYGRIGSGKTYAATKDILDLLKRGQVVYANWDIQYNGYDQRDSIFGIIIGILFPWKKTFFVFPKDNLKKINVDKEFHANFSKITDAHVFLDEGHVVFDSYEMARLSIERRMSILHTRHFDRSIHIISQRPTAIHVSMRANVNVFYRCEKVLTWPFIVFKRTEFQDMMNETVDEAEELEIDTKHYIGRKEVFNAYDTKYLRGDVVASQKVHVEGYKMSWLSKIARLWRNITRTPKNI